MRVDGAGAGEGHGLGTLEESGAMTPPSSLGFQGWGLSPA